MENKRLRPLYIAVNLVLLAVILFCLMRVPNRNAAGASDMFMALLAGIGAFAAFNGYWSIDLRNYSWFHRNDETHRLGNMWLVLLIAGSAILALCAVWLVFRLI